MSVALTHKMCSKCRILKSKDEFWPDPKSKSGLRSHCKGCINQATYASRKKRPQHYAAEAAKWRESNPTYSKEYWREWYAQNAEKRARQNAEFIQQAQQALPDWYVRRALVSGANLSDVPPEMIEMKREQLLLRRFARELRAATTNHKEAP
jgi:hypothetical protein